MWNGMFSPMVIKSEEDFAYAKVLGEIGNMAYVDVVFSHIDVCFRGEGIVTRVPSNYKTYTYEIELDPGESAQTIQTKLDNSLVDGIEFLRDRHTPIYSEIERGRIERNAAELRNRRLE